MAENSSRIKRYITGPLGIQARPIVIVFDHLSAAYQGQVVLHDISLEIYEGESVAILRKPDAGGSMLLACIQGLLQPMHGHIQVMGTEVPPLTPVTRRQVGFMPRYLDQPDKLTVADYVQCFAALHEIHLSHDQLNTYIHHYKLPPLFPTSQLTPLQTRVLQFALALVHDPRLVLLDEPLAGLPETDSTAIWQRLRQIQSEGRTLIATFTPSIARERLSVYDLIVELDQGHIVRQETGKG